MPSRHVDHTIIRASRIVEIYEEKSASGVSFLFDNYLFGSIENEHIGLIASLCTNKLSVYYDDNDDRYIAVSSQKSQNGVVGQWAVEIDYDDVRPDSSREAMANQRKAKPSSI